MALTRPRLTGFDTSVTAFTDPITVLHQGATTANVDVGFLFNRANGLVSNVAIYWSEFGNTFVTAFTANTGLTNSNITVTGYGNLITGSHIVNGTITATTLNAATIGNTGAVHTGSTLSLTSWANIAGPLVVTNNTAVQAIQVAGTSTKGGAGYHDFLLVTNQGGGTNPNKTFRMNSTGNFEIINSAYTQNIFTLTDAGALTVPAISIGGSLGTNGQVLSSTGSGLQWVASGGFSGGSVPNQTTFASNIVASAGTASTSSTTGALVVVGGIGTSGNVWAGQVYSTNNGNGTNFAVGDDTWIGDINIANTMGIKGQQDPTQGYIVFGNANNTNYIGRSGSNPITVTGAFSVTGTTTLSTASFSGVTTYTANIVAASGTSSTNTTTGALVVTGGAGISGDLYVGATATFNGNVNIGGNLTVTGQSVSIGASSLSINDPVINLNTSADLTPLTSATTADIGIKFHYYSGTDRHGFLGRAVDTGYLEYYADGNDTANVFTGTTYGTIKSGALVLANVAGTVLSVAGNTAITSTLYAQGIYDNGARALSSVTVTAGTGMSGGGTISGPSGTVTLTNAGVTGLSSSGAGNLTVSASTGAITAALPTSGPGATTVGSSTAIPVITTDAYGRVYNTTTAAVVAPAGTLTGSTLASGVTASSLTSVGTLTGLTVSGTIAASTNNTINIGASGQTFATVYATTFSGVSTTAKYADLAENYTADATYEPGTVVVFGGLAEITTTSQDHDCRVAGVISTNPAYLMNSKLDGLPVAFTGRVPCLVQGPVQKGQVLVTSKVPGVAQAIDNSKFIPGCVLGKALETINTNNIETIEVVVGRF